MLGIVALMVVRNGGKTLERVLPHLADNTIDAIVIDHGSVDRTPQILSDCSPRPVLEVVRAPFDGVHRWRENLTRKAEIARRVPHDWIIHLDADEIMESPREGETLRGMIERIDREAFDVIECDEFVFVPTTEDEDHSRGDFVATMRRYYHFAPPGRYMQRAVRASASSFDWPESGGHRVSMEDVATATERIRLRHYVGLSLDHLRQQYLGRVYGAEELTRGWHRRRVATSADFVVTPPEDRLLDLDIDGWRTDHPEPSHLIFNQRKPFRLPQPIPPAGERAPMPFVVGVGRSGTTLLRLMLDAHPDLAMTPETHWLIGLIGKLDAGGDVGAVRRALSSHEFWPEMQLDSHDLDQVLQQHDPQSPFETIRAIYSAYAERHGKTRAGDKTPAHGLHMVDIARALPEARFIHLLRDGRDVALSHRGLWFGPPDTPRDGATFWLWRIREMRQQAQFVPHYLEVRYEDLLRDTESVLRRVGEFIDLPFHPAQLRAHRRARRRLSELGPRSVKGTIISAERRRSIHLMTELPPDESRIDRWRREMAPEDVEAFERIAGVMLLDLGYDLSDGWGHPNSGPDVADGHTASSN